MKAIVSSAVLIAALSVLSGCSNDPTSEDFKEFAEGYAKQVCGDKHGEDGSVAKVVCKLVDHDLRKTDSLTMPYQGTATFELDISNLFVYADFFPNGKTEAIYHNKLKLDFAWNGEKWIDKGGENLITSVSLPSVPTKDRDKYGPLHITQPKAVSPEDSNKLQVFLINGYATPN